jgi:hypothetical protein
MKLFIFLRIYAPNDPQKSRKFKRNNVIFIFLFIVVGLHSDRFMHYMAAKELKSDGYRFLLHLINGGGSIVTRRDLEKQFIRQQALPFVSL